MNSSHRSSLSESVYLQAGCLSINDAAAPVKQTTVLAFCVPVYMPADRGIQLGQRGGHRVLLCDDQVRFQ